MVLYAQQASKQASQQAHCNFEAKVVLKRRKKPAYIILFDLFIYCNKVKVSSTVAQVLNSRVV
jgi:hypothetical protein